MAIMLQGVDYRIGAGQSFILGKMVVGNYYVDPRFIKFFHLVKSGNPAIYGNYQSCFFLSDGFNAPPA